MKSLLSILLNALVIAATPTPIYNQTHTTANENQTNNENEDSDFAAYSDFHPPVESDFNTKEKLYSFYERLSAKVGYLMQRDYAILQKLLKTNEDVRSLPFEEFTKGMNLFNKSDFNYGSEYNFGDLNVYWESIFKFIKEVNFNYENFLNNYVRERIKSDEDVKAELREKKLFSTFQTKISDIVHIKVVAMEFEALTYLKDDLNNQQLKDLVFQILRNTNGTNPSSPRFEETIKQFIPIIQEIRKVTGRNVIKELLIEEENNLAFEKERTQTKQEIEKIQGLEQYQNIKQRFEAIQPSRENIELLKSIKNEAILLFDNEKQKTMDLILKLKDKKDFIQRVESATTISHILEVYQEALLIKQKEEFDQEKAQVKIHIDKTEGSSKYDVFINRFNEIENNKEELLDLKQQAIDEFNVQKQKVINLVQTLKKQSRLNEEVEEANNITNLQIIYDKALKIQEQEEKYNHIKEVEIIILKTKGSSKFLDFKNELDLLSKNYSSNKLDELKQKAQNEFNIELEKTFNELKKVNDQIKNQKITESINAANNIEELLKIKFEINEILKEKENNNNSINNDSKNKTTNENKDKINNNSQNKENINNKKTNVAAIVTPIVLIIILGVAGFLAYWFIKKNKLKKKQ